MPWRIGIDEAGWGPNLGPFVMSAVACHVPDSLAGVSLWKTLRRLVRQAHHQADRRLVIDDSKKIYSSGKGLADLEAAALLALDCEVQGLDDLLPLLAPEAPSELKQECWFTGMTPVPLASDAASLTVFAVKWRELCAEHNIRWLRPCSEILCTPRFNTLIDQYDSKAAVQGLTFVRLIQRILEQATDDSIQVTVDKHGGRNYYQALLQHAFPDGWVLPREETARQSVYDVLNLSHPLRITFCVEGDGSEMTVALASMISKYLREALMAEWNAFWQKEVPGLKPTAGYPGDSRRFYEEISPAAKRLKLTEETLWRKR